MTTSQLSAPSDYLDASGPLRSGLLGIEWMLDEPFYELMRQQLLAWRLEQDRAEGADAVRILHVLPPGNCAYQGVAGTTRAPGARRHRG